MIERMLSRPDHRGYTRRKALTHRPGGPNDQRELT